MRRRLIMGIIAAIAVGGIVYIFSSPTRTTTLLPSVVQSVSPQPGDYDLKQVTISADLISGYTGYLTFDNVEIDADDLQIVSALNSITLKPQPDSSYKELPPGHHCAGVVYWPLNETRAQGMTYNWCFNLH